MWSWGRHRRLMMVGGIVALSALPLLLPRIVERTADQIVAEFPITVGWHRLTTLERVTMDAERRRVTFEQLRSPFFTVQGATEVFGLRSAAGGGTVVTLQGVLRPRLGLLGWFITDRVVRPRWDAIDGRFMARMRERAESTRG